MTITLVPNRARRANSWTIYDGENAVGAVRKSKSPVGCDVYTATAFVWKPHMKDNEFDLKHCGTFSNKQSAIDAVLSVF